MTPVPPPGHPWPSGFTATCLRATLYILLIAGLAQGAYIEALHYPEVRFSEYGFTELAQSAVLLTASLLLLYTRQVLRVLPTVTLLMFAFTFSSFIREQDYFLDTWVARHTWKVLVAMVILPVLFWVIRERTLAGLAAARARGRKGGRRPVMPAADVRKAAAMLADPR